MNTPHRKVVNVTPEWATKHPAHPSRQRTASAMHISRIAELIRNGQFIEGDLCPAPIHLDAEGFCIDGQHRLAAVAKAGVTVKMPVIFNSHSRLVEQDHIVKSRSIVDRAKLISCGYYNATAHSVTHYAFSSARKLREVDVYLWLARFDAIREHYKLFLDTAMKKEPGRIGFKAKGVPIVMGVCLRAIAVGADVAKVHTFFDHFCSNTGPAITKNLFVMRMNLDSFLEADTTRHAFHLVTQYALVDYLNGKQRKRAYTLPVEERVDARGNKTLQCVAADVIPVPEIEKLTV